MKEKIQNLYVEEGMKMEGVADELDITQAAVSYHIQDMDIDTGHRDWSPVPIFHTKSGYAYWQDGHGGEKNSVYIHRLLAVAEHGFDAVADSEVHHKNGVGWDNRPDNIEPLTPKEHRQRHIGERDYSFFEKIDRDENGKLLPLE